MEAKRTSSRRAKGIVWTDETDAPHRGHMTVNIATSLRRTIMES